MLRPSFVCFASLLCLAACAASPPPPPPPPLPKEPVAVPKNIDRDVAAVERAFAATMAKRDFAAFGAFISDEAIFVSGRRTMRGKTEVLEAWKRFFEKPEAPFSWEPAQVEVLDSGLLALSMGPVKAPNGQIVAKFISIWRYEAGGWRILFDTGVDTPACDSSAAMNGATAARPDFAAYRQNLGLAQEAYNRKDYAAFLEKTQKAAAAFPNNPRALYNVACGQALTGKPSDAISQLENLAQMHLTFPAQKDEDLASLQANPQFKAVVDRFAKLESTVVGQSVSAFSLPEKDMIPEGIVHDPKTGSFFVGSVHKRKIIRVPAKGAPAEFASKGLDAVLGMAIDEKRRALWVCSSAIPEMTGYAEADKGRASVVEFDIDTGKTRRALRLDEKGGNHLCNDLAVDGEGNLFVSDPGASMLYFLPNGGKSLETYVPVGKFAAPQGIALTRDQKSLFVADYSRGLAHIDRATHEVTWLNPSSDATLVGIDGLTLVGDDLIAIQNGVRPHRIIRLSVDVPAKTVRKATILQMNHAHFDEPTLGVVVGKEFFYVANSQWGHFNKGQLDSLDKLNSPVILKLKLD